MDTTSIHQLPSQDLTNSLINGNGGNGGMNTVNMVIRENEMNRSHVENEKRLTAEEMNAKIRAMNSAIVVPPSERPQASSPYQPQQQQQQQQPQQQPQQPPSAVSQNEMGNLFNSLNQLNAMPSNVAGIPTHHLNSGDHFMDPSVQINYREPPSREAMIRQYYGNGMEQGNETGNLQQRKSLYQTIFDELKIPLLICCLFFIFQMPFYRQNLHKHFQFLFQSDGNMNLYGYLSSSILFSIGYYILNKVVHV